MYQALGAANLLRNVLYINAFFAAVLATSLWGWLPDTPLLRAVSLSVLVTMAVLYGVGQTALFPRICRLPFLWHLFPDIDGDYDVEIASNWSLIQAREQGKPPTHTDTGPLLFRKSGALNIRARLFTIDLHLTMDDKYLTSDTVVCSVKKEPGEARPSLSYIYRAKVLQPQGTDSSQHFGAARIEIPKQRKITVLEGTYWTDRNWHQARNTAGGITLRRRPKRKKGS